ncbi:MAG: GerAB/ArcD/ProY family transporter, partial [Oscillospiraceae bacterium]|nr:GerAB/ArcD/ProY family transporter [Oscillospiraceae bacterium]
MEDKKLTMLSRGQLISLGWVALLSPVIRQLPRSAVHVGGRGSWLSPLFALPLLLLYLWFLSAFLRSCGEGEGLQHQFCRALGRIPGRALLLLYALWLSFYMGFVLRAGADRFIAAVYPSSGPSIFILIMAALGLMAGLGRLKVLGRCAQVVQPLLIFSLLLILWSALPKIELANLLPLDQDELAKAARGGLPVAGTLTFTVYAAFLEHRVERGHEGKSLLLPLLGTVLLVLALGIVT